MKFISTTIIVSIFLLANINNSHAESSFVFTPSVGTATVSNIDGYSSALSTRFDALFFIIPQLGFNIFYNNYEDFKTTGSGAPVSLSLYRYGLGAIARWPINKHIEPFIRAEYFSWNSKAKSLGNTIGTDEGNSSGIALGIHFPIKKFFGLKLELQRSNEISGATIDQVSFGTTFEF